MMFLYAFFVMTANLSLGYLVGRWSLCSPGFRAFLARSNRPSPTLKPAVATAVTLKTTDPVITTSATIAPSPPRVAPSQQPAPPVPKKTPLAWSTEKSWSDFDQQLRTLKERIGYARSADEKRLGQDIASQLNTCVISWTSQIQKCLEEGAAAGSEDTDQARLEMYLAQFESTAANIAALDWSQELKTTLQQVEQEIELLAKTRRQIG
jgi:hypothetical protein